MSGQTYQQPQLPAGAEVAMLRREDDKANELTPETFVTCINRGRQVLVDMFDSQRYAIPPGYFQCQYGAALHFQRRQVVPGTRIPGQGHKSWIGILNVDKPVMCEPFTDAELEEFGEAVEAINRSALPGADGDVKYLGTSGARSTLEGEGLVGGGFQSSLGGGAPRPQLNLEADTEAGRSAADTAMQPAGSTARQEEAEAAGEGWTPPVDDGRSASVPRPNAGRLADGMNRGGSKKRR